MDPAIEQARGRILIVDDEEIVHATIKRLLEPTDYTFFSAYSGKEALAEVESGYDLMLLDIRMPQMNGIEVLRRIRQRHLPIEIIILTGYASMESAVSTLNYGVHCYLMKPIENVRNFREEVQKAIYKSRLWRHNKQFYDGILLGQEPDVGDKKTVQQPLVDRALVRHTCPRIMEIVHDAVALLDCEGTIGFGNVHLANMLGMPYETVVGTTLMSYVAREDRDELREFICQLCRGEVPSAIRARLKPKHVPGRSVIISGSAIHKKEVCQGVALVIMDVTETVEVGEKAELLAGLVEHSRHTMVLIAQRSGQIVECNALAKETFGYSRKQFLATHVSTVLKWPEGGWKATLEHLERETCSQAELTAATRNGREFPVEAVVSLQGPLGRRGEQIVCCLQDITERKAAEQALRTSEIKYRTLVEGMNEVIFALDTNGEIRSINGAVQRLLGYTPGEVIGKHFTEFIACETSRSCTALLDGNVKRQETVFTTKDGSPRYVDICTTRVLEKGMVVGLQGIVTDITERRHADEALRTAYAELRDTHVQLLQAGKMAAMGAMAAGVVHELTQPLTAIKGFAEAMSEDIKNSVQRKAASTSELRTSAERSVADLDVILAQTQRMLTILSIVRKFARSSGTGMSRLDVNKPIEDALALFAEQLRLHDISVVQNLHPDLPKVWGNSNQLQQVLINLVTNARDAMDSAAGEKRLTIRTSKSATSDCVIITCADTGIGPDAQTKEKMFDPFFTTKEAGQGTGLGLSIVARIIEQHKGTILVEGEPDQGCTFTIHLPGAPDEAIKNR